MLRRLTLGVGSRIVPRIPLTGFRRIHQTNINLIDLINHLNRIPRAIRSRPLYRPAYRVPFASQRVPRVGAFKVVPTSRWKALVDYDPTCSVRDLVRINEEHKHFAHGSKRFTRIRVQNLELTIYCDDKEVTTESDFNVSARLRDCGSPITLKHVDGRKYYRSREYSLDQLDDLLARLHHQGPISATRALRDTAEFDAEVAESRRSLERLIS